MHKPIAHVTELSDAVAAVESSAAEHTPGLQAVKSDNLTTLRISSSACCATMPQLSGMLALVSQGSHGISCAAYIVVPQGDTQRLASNEAIDHWPASSSGSFPMGRASFSIMQSHEAKTLSTVRPVDNFPMGKAASRMQARL